jgi:hypothetical protein
VIGSMNCLGLGSPMLGSLLAILNKVKSLESCHFLSLRIRFSVSHFVLASLGKLLLKFLMYSSSPLNRIMLSG